MSDGPSHVVVHVIVEYRGGPPRDEGEESDGSRGGRKRRRCAANRARGSAGVSTPPVAWEDARWASSAAWHGDGSSQQGAGLFPGGDAAAGAGGSTGSDASVAYRDPGRVHRGGRQIHPAGFPPTREAAGQDPRHCALRVSSRIPVKAQRYAIRADRRRCSSADAESVAASDNDSGGGPSQQDTGLLVFPGKDVEQGHHSGSDASANRDPEHVHRGGAVNDSSDGHSQQDTGLFIFPGKDAALDTVEQRHRSGSDASANRDPEHVHRGVTGAPGRRAGLKRQPGGAGEARLTGRRAAHPWEEECDWSDTSESSHHVFESSAGTADATSAAEDPGESTAGGSSSCSSSSSSPLRPLPPKANGACAVDPPGPTVEHTLSALVGRRVPGGDDPRGSPEAPGAEACRCCRRGGVDWEAARRCVGALVARVLGAGVERLVVARWNAVCFELPRAVVCRTAAAARESRGRRRRSWVAVVEPFVRRHIIPPGGVSPQFRVGVHTTPLGSVLAAHIPAHTRPVTPGAGGGALRRTHTLPPAQLPGAEDADEAAGLRQSALVDRSTTTAGGVRMNAEAQPRSFTTVPLHALGTGVDPGARTSLNENGAGGVGQPRSPLTQDPHAEVDNPRRIPVLGRGGFPGAGRTALLKNDAGEGCLAEAAAQVKPCYSTRDRLVAIRDAFNSGSLSGERAERMLRGLGPELIARGAAEAALKADRVDDLLDLYDDEEDDASQLLTQRPRGDEADGSGSGGSQRIPARRVKSKRASFSPRPTLSSPAATFVFLSEASPEDGAAPGEFPAFWRGRARGVPFPREDGLTADVLRRVLSEYGCVLGQPSRAEAVAAVLSMVEAEVERGVRVDRPCATNPSFLSGLLVDPLRATPASGRICLNCSVAVPLSLQLSLLLDLVHLAATSVSVKLRSLASDSASAVSAPRDAVGSFEGIRGMALEALRALVGSHSWASAGAIAVAGLAAVGTVSVPPSQGCSSESEGESPGRAPSSSAHVSLSEASYQRLMRGLGLASLQPPSVPLHPLDDRPADFVAVRRAATAALASGGPGASKSALSLSLLSFFRSCLAPALARDYESLYRILRTVSRLDPEYCGDILAAYRLLAECDPSFKTMPRFALRC
ncbi:hypothetical protein DIPPA_27705 [Diplonema papillatum]|nr:hypothetical protein DIPPA_27705 [Diplonema papillatum]